MSTVNFSPFYKRPKPTPLRTLGVTGTPTLILLNRDTVTHAWVGKLPDEEAEVLSKL